MRERKLSLGQLKYEGMSQQLASQSKGMLPVLLSSPEEVCIIAQARGTRRFAKNALRI